MADPQDWMRRAEAGSSGRAGSFGFRFRQDLRVLRESVEDGNRINVRVVDPLNGKHYSFNEQEFFLCEAADGVSTPQAIVDRYQQQFGEAITPRELRSFYRRLKILGLTEPVSGGPEGPGPRSGRTDEEPGRRPAWAAGERPRGGGQGAARLLGAMSSEQDPGAFIRALVQARAGQSGGGTARRPSQTKLNALWLATPGSLYTFLFVLLYPLKFLHWLVWPGVLLAGLTIFHRWGDFSEIASRLVGSTSTIALLIAGLLSVNLASRLAQGTVLSRVSGKPPRFGMVLVFGIIPRFVVDTASVSGLAREDQLRVYAAPLLARLAAFVIGILVWALYRHTGSTLSDGALLLGLMGLGAFTLTASPLLPGDGISWLSVQLGDPQLKAKAFGALRAKLGGKAIAKPGAGVDTITLALFGAAIVLSAALLVLGFLITTAITLEAQWQGAGVALFLGILVAFLAWCAALRLKIRQQTQQTRNAGPRGFAAQFAGAASEVEAPDARHAADLDGEAEVFDGGVIAAPGEDEAPRAAIGARLFWSVLLVAALAVAFLPYEYETGGNFRVLPVEHQSVAVRTDGEVTEIMVREGDWVEAGQVLAQLSSWDEERDLAVTAAELEKAKAVLADLEARPKPEQIALAQRQVESARSVVAFGKAEFDRAEILYKSGSGSLQALEKARTTHDQNLANLNVAIANLDLVKSGATEPELEAARAEVRRLSHDLDYRRDQVERTRVRAPSAGRVITPNVHLLAGKYLTNGQAFVELEDTRVVQVEIDVPETDIEHVQIGDEVRIRAWSYTDRIIPGAVSGIAPAVETRDFGEVIRINADIPNEDGELKTGMSGYAKVAGSEMPVWRAYLSLFVRFFRVEVWSWIP